MSSSPSLHAVKASPEYTALFDLYAAQESEKLRVREELQQEFNIARQKMETEIADERGSLVEFRKELERMAEELQRTAEQVRCKQRDVERREEEHQKIRLAIATQHEEHIAEMDSKRRRQIFESRRIRDMLEAQISEKDSSIRDLSERIKISEREYDALQTAMLKVQSEDIEGHSEIQRLRQEVTASHTLVRDLQHEKKMIQVELDNYRSVHEDMKDAAQYYKGEYMSLSKRYNQLLDFVAQTERQRHAREREVSELQKEIASLRLMRSGGSSALDRLTSVVLPNLTQGSTAHINGSTHAPAVESSAVDLRQLLADLAVSVELSEREEHRKRRLRQEKEDRQYSPPAAAQRRNQYCHKERTSSGAQNKVQQLYSDVLQSHKKLNHRNIVLPRKRGERRSSRRQIQDVSHRESEAKECIGHEEEIFNVSQSEDESDIHNRSQSQHEHPVGGHDVSTDQFQHLHANEDSALYSGSDIERVRLSSMTQGHYDFNDDDENLEYVSTDIGQCDGVASTVTTTTCENPVVKSLSQRVLSRARREEDLVRLQNSLQQLLGTGVYGIDDPIIKEMNNKIEELRGSEGQQLGTTSPKREIL